MGLRAHLEDENASVRRPLSMNRCPLLCHPDRSEAKGRDLQFAPLATKSLWSCCPPPCHPDRSEAKRKGGTCGSADLSWKCFLLVRSLPLLEIRRAKQEAGHQGCLFVG